MPCLVPRTGAGSPRGRGRAPHPDVRAAHDPIPFYPQTVLFSGCSQVQFTVGQTSNTRPPLKQGFVSLYPLTSMAPGHPPSSPAAHMQLPHLRETFPSPLPFLWVVASFTQL